jgi:hypothetical protein
MKMISNHYESLMAHTTHVKRWLQTIINNTRRILIGRQLVSNDYIYTYINNSYCEHLHYIKEKARFHMLILFAFPDSI